MVRAVKTLARTDQNHVGLRLIVTIHMRRILDRDNYLVAKAPDQDHIRSGHGHRMPGPDRTHLDDLAFDELDPIFVRKDSRLRHFVIVVDGESLSLHFNLRRNTHREEFTDSWEQSRYSRGR
jgi:hypothetical protein